MDKDLVPHLVHHLLELFIQLMTPGDSGVQGEIVLQTNAQKDFV